MAELAYVNGAFHPIAEAFVSVEDRGLQFGDSVYEVIAVYDGRPFALERHLQRLKRSCEQIRLFHDFVEKPLEPVIQEGLRRSGLRDAHLYLQITRGTAPRSHMIPPDIAPTVIMTIREFKPLPQELRRRGARLVTIVDPRWARCNIKATTLLPNVLARNEALARGYDDAVFITPEGEVRECTAANIFAVAAGALFMPRRTEAVLHGVTQAVLLECAAETNIPVEERTIDVATLLRVEEVFISSTSAEVLGVTSIDDSPIADGRIGPITRQLHAAYLAKARPSGENRRER